MGQIKGFSPCSLFCLQPASRRQSPQEQNGRQDPELVKLALQCVWAAEGFARTFIKPLNLTELMPRGWG